MVLGFILGVLFLTGCEKGTDVPAIEVEVTGPQPTATSIDQKTAVSSTVTPSPPPDPTPDPLAAPLHRIQAGDLLLAAETDDIPAIFANDSLFVLVEPGNEEWQAADLVIGVQINEETRAYPIRLLSSHEIVNDQVGGQSIAVSWCPLCFSALVYDRIIDGRELTFGVSGYLYNDNLVMYDHQTNTLWSQLVGQGIRGAMRGQPLKLLPALMTSWGEWQTLHPGTTVLSAVQMGQTEAIIDPYAGYYTSGAAGFGGGDRDERLPGKSLIVGLVAGQATKAFPLPVVRSEQIINDQVGVLPVLILFETALETAVTYDRRLGPQTLTFRHNTAGQLIDNETGSQWDSRTGAAVAGPLAGEKLQQLPGPLVFWFAWSAMHPETAVYSESKE